MSALRLSGGAHSAPQSLRSCPPWGGPAAKIANIMGAIESTDVLRRHRLTVAQYQRMGEAGVLGPGDRVELIEGELVDMAPIGTRHASTVKRLNQIFSAAVGAHGIVAVQDPLRLDDHSEPEPDLMLLRPRDDFYAAAHPVPADVLLLVEVSESTARYDREIKVPLYARHGVPEVWVVDLDERTLRIYGAPLAGAYTRVSATTTPGVLAPALLPELRIDLAPLLR